MTQTEKKLLLEMYKKIKVQQTQLDNIQEGIQLLVDIKTEELKR